MPPGRDPGGTPVAIVGTGVDYTKNGVAARLARDGEGEIIGYDFADDDRRPFSADAAAQDTVGIVLSEGQATRLVPVRMTSASISSFAKAVNYAGLSPAKIILLEAPLDGPRFYGMIAAAARHFRDRLFVVPAGVGAHDLDKELPAIVRETPNLLIVAGADGQGAIPADADTGATALELSTDGRVLDNPIAGTGAANAPVSSPRAAARVAALAARILAVEPFIAGEALKARIAGLAKPVPGAVSRTRSGFIERPTHHFWLD